VNVAGLEQDRPREHVADPGDALERVEIRALPHLALDTALDRTDLLVEGIDEVGISLNGQC